MSLKRQCKINKKFNKKREKEPDDDCGDLNEEIARLEQILKEKQDELFQVTRNLYRNKLLPPKKRSEIFIRPQKIVENSKISSLQKKLDIMLMLTDIEVQSNLTDDHCCIMYYLNCSNKDVVKHGLRINVKNNVKEIEKLSMPVGFDLEAILDQYEDIIKPECVIAIRKGLVAYYDRLKQFDKLKVCLKLEAQTFKMLDGSHIEVQFVVQADDEEEIDLRLMLDYGIFDIRPKSTFVEHDLPEGAAEVIRAQCAVFKLKSLARAFRDAFISPCGEGRYKLVRKMFGSSPASRERPERARPPHGCRDDTFLPDTEPSDDDEQ